MLLTLTLLAFGTADAVRGTAPVPPGNRLGAAWIAGIASVVIVGLLAGLELDEVLVVAAALGIPLAGWQATSVAALKARPRMALAGIMLVFLAAVGANGSLDPAGGRVSDWYADSDFAFGAGASANQVLLAAAVGLFLIWSGNRVVRVVLDCAGSPAEEGERKLKGGRWLGVLERLFVAGLVIAGELTGAAIIIAAKGLLRLPEIKDSDQTEYFLIGTLASLVLACVLGAMVLALS